MLVIATSVSTPMRQLYRYTYIHIEETDLAHMTINIMDNYKLKSQFNARPTPKLIKRMYEHKLTKSTKL